MGLCNPLDIGIYENLPCSQGRWHELASDGGVVRREYDAPIALLDPKTHLRAGSHDPPAAVTCHAQVVIVTSLCL